MIEHTFTLVPFPGNNIPEIHITGGTVRDQGILTIWFSLAGNIEGIFIPAPALHPGRKVKLWLATCFEFFLAIPDRPQYWEFNLSPSGDWNVFRMNAYRRIGFCEETLIPTPEILFEKDPDLVHLEATFDLRPILEPETRIQAGVTCVVQTRDGQESYWALIHPGPKADFHARDSFILTL